ncbi:MAG: hypothetical protein Tsb0014_22300 [Pleurocapsa sp.]
MNERINKFYKKFLISIVLVIFLATIPKHLLLQPIQATNIENTSQVNPSQLVIQGKEYYQDKNYNEAIKVWQQARNIYQVRRDKLNQATVLNYLGLAYIKSEQLPAAEKAIASSLKLLDSLENKNLSIFAQTLNTQGSLQLAQGDTRQAIITWQQATEIYRQIGDKEGEIGSLINQAQGMQDLGLYIQARQNLTQVKDILAQQGDRELKIFGLRKLGNIERLMGNLAESNQILQEALAIAKSLKSDVQISASLLDLGNLATAKREYETASNYYQQVINLAPSPTTKLKAQLNQLRIFVDTQEYTKAIKLSRVLQPQLDKLSVNKNNISDRLNYLSSLIQLQNVGAQGLRPETKIIQFAQTTLQQTENIKDQKLRAIALGYLGKINEQKQNWTKAEEYTKQALSIAQYLNSEDIIYQWQWQLGRIYKAQGNIKEATIAYQQAYDTLRSLRRDLVGINSDVQFSFRESIEPLYRELVDLLLTDDDNSPITQTKLQESRQIIESLQIAELENFFRSNCIAGQIVPVDNIPQTNAAIIYPIILPNRIEVILSLPQQPLTHAGTYISESEVNDTIQKLSLSLRKPFTAPEGKLLGKQIYDWSIKPLETKLKTSQVNTLVFVLDGELGNIPMSALYDGEKYLIEKYNIGLAPGLQLLDPKPLQQVKLKALVGGLSQSRHGFTALENVKREVAQINAQLPSKVLLDSTFTSTALQNQIATIPYPVVHLASHGQFSSNADETFIVAWDKPIKVKELNDFLRQSQQTEDKALELLVLSACETATGDKKAALGLAGVAVQAGARSTLATLWTVSDEATAEFMSQFYRLLSQGNLSKVEALRQTQLTLLKDPNYDTPYLWAAFVLLGNWL